MKNKIVCLSMLLVAMLLTVDAQAQFKNLDPIPPTYSAWAKSQVDKNLIPYCSGGSSSS